MPFALAEQKIWNKSLSTDSLKMSDLEISAKYERGKQRIVTKINREKLPNFVVALKKPGYVDIKSWEQRKPPWNAVKRSRLIESLVSNIPIPPIILYEKSFHAYEVIDGQQRIIAIKDFYNNKFKLEGLELWPELKGRTYAELPRTIKSGLDRRSLSFIVLVTESASNPEEALFLKQRAFERLNSGGVNLSKQEVRSCLYQGKFNSLLLELSRYPIFAQAWEIPADVDEQANNFYTKMEDVELVLRFFALRHLDNFTGNLEELLDIYTIKSINFSQEDIDFLRNFFLETINLAYNIYEESLFKIKPFAPTSHSLENVACRAYYDAVMVGFSNHLAHAELLLARKFRVIEETKKFLGEDKLSLLTGGEKTQADIANVLKSFEEMLSQIIAE